MSINTETTSGIALTGFQNLTFDSTQIFRQALEAMSRPGHIQSVVDLCAHPENLNAPTAALLLALADMETNIWLTPELDSQQARDFLAFHTGAQIVERIELCQFAIVDARTSVETLKKLPIGSPEYPDRSAMIIMAVSAMTNDDSLSLTGPGIKDKQSLNVAPLPDDFWNWFTNNSQKFPCGVDVIFATGSQICAVPRTVKVES